MRRKLYTSMGKIENIRLDAIKTGSILHSLTPDQKKKIRVFQAVFFEVFPIPIEEFFDGFQRDENPDREIAIWEKMASVYEHNVIFCKDKEDREKLFATILQDAPPIVVIRGKAVDSIN